MAVFSSRTQQLIQQIIQARQARPETASLFPNLQASKARPTTKPGAITQAGPRVYGQVIDFRTGNPVTTTPSNQPSQPAAFNLGQEAPQPAQGAAQASQALTSTPELHLPNDANDLRLLTAQFMPQMDRPAPDTGQDHHQKPEDGATDKPGNGMSSLQQEYAAMYPGLSEAQIQALVDGPDGNPRHHGNHHKHHEEHASKPKHAKHDHHNDPAHHKEHKPNVAPKGPDFGSMA